jgi:hypothetical protein
MKAAHAALAAALAGVLPCGCGTICNLASGDPQVPYGGVQKDLEHIETPSDHSLGSSRGKAGAVVLAVLPVELGLSFVGDWVTLPLAVYLRQDRGDRQAARPPDLSAPCLGATLGPTEPDDPPSPDTPRSPKHVRPPPS